MGASYFFWASNWNVRNAAATRVSHPTPAPYCNPSLIDGDNNQGEEERIEGRSEKRNSIEIRKPRGTSGLENAMGGGSVVDFNRREEGRRTPSKTTIHPWVFVIPSPTATTWKRNQNNKQQRLGFGCSAGIGEQNSNNRHPWAGFNGSDWQKKKEEDGGFGWCFIDQWGLKSAAPSCFLLSEPMVQSQREYNNIQGCLDCFNRQGMSKKRTKEEVDGLLLFLGSHPRSKKKRKKQIFEVSKLVHQ
ncbi:hypothetical protein Lser_V15G29769 [Lactuca serriola]